MIILMKIKQQTISHSDRQLRALNAGRSYISRRWPTPNSDNTATSFTSRHRSSSNALHLLDPPSTLRHRTGTSLPNQRATFLWPSSNPPPEPTRRRHFFFDLQRRSGCSTDIPQQQALCRLRWLGKLHIAAGCHSDHLRQQLQPVD